MKVIKLKALNCFGNEELNDPVCEHCQSCGLYVQCCETVIYELSVKKREYVDEIDDILAIYDFKTLAKGSEKPKKYNLDLTPDEAWELAWG